MTVFKGFLRLLKKNSVTVSLFLLIFVGMAIMVQTSGSQSQLGKTFESSQTRIAIADQDQSILSKSLVAYLNQTQKVIRDAKIETADQIQDSLYHSSVYSVIKLPKGFETTYLSQGRPLELINKPGFESAAVTNQVNQFLSQVKVLTDSGEPVAQAVVKVQGFHQEKSQVSLVSHNKTENDLSFHNVLFRYLPYILISMASYSLGLILILYAEPSIKRRLLASPVSYQAMNAQLLLGTAVIGGVLWLICALGLPTLLSAKAYYSDPNLPYYLINVTLMTLTALSLSFFMSKWLKRADLISNVTNVLALGMSFLCGVFVPLSMLSPMLKRFTQFLPVYWYEVTNELIGYHTTFNGAQLMSLYKGFGIQLLFIIALLSLGMLAGKMREQTI